MEEITLEEKLPAPVTEPDAKETNAEGNEGATENNEKMECDNAATDKVFHKYIICQNINFIINACFYNLIQAQDNVDSEKQEKQAGKSKPKHVKKSTKVAFQTGVTFSMSNNDLQKATEKEVCSFIC